MRLRRVQVQNFRSIVDSGVVDIEDRVTVIIGKNEQGKTNFLKALASFSPKATYSPNDLPNHLRPTLEERNPSDIPIVTVWLAPDTIDKANLLEVVPAADAIEEFKIIRYYDGHYTYFSIKAGGEEAPIEFSRPQLGPLIQEIKGQAGHLKVKLNAHAGRVTAFEPSLSQAQTHIDLFVSATFGDIAQIDNLIKTFSTGLKGLPGQDEAIQDDIAAAVREIQTKYAEIQQHLQEDPLKLFQRSVPHFLFHSTVLDRIPNEVNISDFIRDPQGTSKGMGNLCAVAGLSIQKIQELASATDTARREAYEDHYRGTISGGLRAHVKRCGNGSGGDPPWFRR